MAPPKKDDEDRKTSPDAESESPDLKGQKDGGTDSAPPEETPEGAEPELEERAPEGPADEARADDEAGERAEDVGDPEQPADRRPVERLGDPDLDEPAEVVREEQPKQSEPVTAATAPAPPSPPAQKSGGRFWTALVGALIGAAVGAGAVWYLLQQMPRGPDPAVTAALDQQESEISAQSDTITALEGEVQALREDLDASDISATVESLRGDTEARLSGLDEGLSGLGDRLEAMESRLSEIRTRLDEGEARLADLEARPIADPETANQALRSEVADMRAEVEQATEDARTQVETMRNELAEAAAQTQAEIEAAEQRAAELEAQARERAAEAEAEAQAAARAAAAQAAMAQIGAALDSGEPYGQALAELSANAETEVPRALAAPAEAGVPTLGELRDGYPDAARAALSASRVATTEGDPGSRVLAFLRTQTAARSLTPQTGDTPDAVLSRAEAALDEGDVTAALAELEALPEDGRAAMQDWIDSAEVRAEAVAAADTLSQGMN